MGKTRKILVRMGEIEKIVVTAGDKKFFCFARVRQ
jgi:hypothetical protein